MEPDATVREVMNREYLGVSESDTVGETASMMLDDGAEVVVVVRGSEPVGIMTERDALAAVVEGSQDAAVAGHPGERAGEGSAEHAFEDQSICEACGSFARDLAQFNGQLLCGDCRDI